MLPEKFKERMKRLLGNGYADFEKAMTEDEPVRAFRINLIKAADKDAVRDSLAKSPVPYEKNAYILKDGIRVGSTPEHHSGVIYVQDPGAMSALAAIDIKKGALAIDLCAAPGGKSTKIAEAIGEGGVLLSNEYVPKRAKLLVGNFERLGIKNAIVTSLDTAELARLYEGVFDLVVADVPCSGEGMFRKSEEALEMWSEENVALCKERQREILENAAGLVADGGTLLYSTCTFSTEENEENVIEFLNTHPDFSLVPVKETLLPYTAPAIDVDGRHPEIALAARRFYPHLARGEGQFVAVMKRNGGGKRKFNYKEKVNFPTKDESSAISRFFSDYMKEVPGERIVKHGENLVLAPKDFPIPPRSVFLSGVLLGEVRGKMLFPSHQLFSAYGELFKNKVELKSDDPRLEKYLRGEQIPSTEGFSGWCAVTHMGAVVGGGKANGTVINNHYPKGLRNKD